MNEIKNEHNNYLVSEFIEDKINKIRRHTVT